MRILIALLYTVTAVAVAAVSPVSIAADADLNLSTAWELGMRNDPQYKAMRSRYYASQHDATISRAGLLPQVEANLSRQRVHGWRKQPGMFGITQRSDLRYDSTNYYIQLRQAVLNYPQWAEYRRGQATTQLGQAQFAVNEQRTGLRVVQGYLEVVLAYEDWQMQRQRVAFLEDRLANFQALQRHEHTTDAEVAETQARLALAQGEAQQAADTLRTNTRQLQSYIGQPVQQVQGVSSQWQYHPLQQSIEALLLTAQRQSRELQAAKQEVAVYKARYDAAVSQYFPTLDLTLSAGKADSEDLSTLSERSNTFAVGLQLHIPIFTGGYATATKQQARHLLTQAEQRLQATEEQVNSQVHKQYSLYSTGAERVQALLTAQSSAQKRLDSAMKSFSVGAASNMDVLDAQDELLDARYEALQARMELPFAYLQLQAALGEPLHEPINTLTRTQFQGERLSLP